MRGRYTPAGNRETSKEWALEQRKSAAPRVVFFSCERLLLAESCR